MGVATNGLAAIPIIGEELGFVTNANLPHLNTRSERSGEILDKFAKVDPLLRELIEHQPLAAENRLDIDEIHL